MKLEHYLVEEKERLLQQKAEIDTELENAPPGKIQIAKSKESYRWRQLVLVPKKSKPVRTEIRKKDRDLAERLCNKQYLLEQKQIIQKRLELIDRFLHDFPFRDDITLSSVHPEFLSLLNSYSAGAGKLRELARVDESAPPKDFIQTVVCFSWPTGRYVV